MKINVGLGLVSIAIFRMLIATMETTVKAAKWGDGPNFVVGGLASATLVGIGVSAFVLPGFWLGLYLWIVGHTFGSPV